MLKRKKVFFADKKKKLFSFVINLGERNSVMWFKTFFFVLLEFDQCLAVLRKYVGYIVTDDFLTIMATLVSINSTKSFLQK